MHFAEEYSYTMLAFSKTVHEIRINLPTRENPPFDLQLTLLVDNDGLSSDQADALNIITKTIRTSLDPKEIHLHPEVRILTEERISMAEYYATRPLFLENHTYKGEEIEGLEPFGRV